MNIPDMNGGMRWGFSEYAIALVAVIIVLITGNEVVAQALTIGMGIQALIVLFLMTRTKARIGMAVQMVLSSPFMIGAGCAMEIILIGSLVIIAVYMLDGYWGAIALAVAMFNGLIYLHVAVDAVRIRFNWIDNNWTTFIKTNYL